MVEAGDDRLPVFVPAIGSVWLLLSVPVIVTEVALVAVTVSVDELPTAIEAGLAVKVTSSVGPAHGNGSGSSNAARWHWWLSPYR